MKPRAPVPHFELVDKSAIKAVFSGDRCHRATLHLPFAGRQGSKTLCVIGQNPSAADEQWSDKTIRYLAELVYRTLPQYGALLVLNLYSRVDTTKSESGTLLDERCEQLFMDAIRAHEDFLLVYGKLRNERAYRFPERARAVESELHSKNVFKLDIGTPYPPHPGNSKILYRNFNVKVAPMLPR
ncbi:MAG TPA: DUF1643 domain-containing protein [Variovorax sp.]|nr:DUF1643 domain-containing protein [Variovorax sp.]